MIPIPRFQHSSAPAFTIWGPPYTTTERLPGIWHVTTASHGGFVLSDERQAAMPVALRCMSVFYEEDVEWTRVVLAFEAERRAAGDPFLSIELPIAHQIARNWLPDAYGAFTGETIAPRDSDVLRRRAAYQAAIGQYVAGAAWGDWADWVPAGKVGVVFRQVESVDALGHATYTAGEKWGLVDKVRYADRVDGDTFESLGAIQLDRPSSRS
ncbi:DUF7007 domain-containing protein [Sphingomonas sp. Leaf4]|uniref:DUF7007 domain-containing protein n=1 Tax=Sphingomonas sp. Leaf4 TaxID=2876553 RepID=UPI001E3715A9|nr:hypothetical protein [Sphingomonas sp. Leaf4]